MAIGYDMNGEAVQRRAERWQRGFTLIELLVTVGVVGILASLLLPSLSRAKEAGRSAVCKSNLRQIGIGLSLYVEDNQRYPGASPHISENQTVGQWFSTTGWIANRGLAQLSPYVRAGEIETDIYGQTSFKKGESSVYYCPSRPAEARTQLSFDMADKSVAPTQSIRVERPLGYGYNALGTLWLLPAARPLGLGPIVVDGEPFWVKPAAVLAPADMIAAGDTTDRYLGNIGPFGGLSEIHHAGANAVFCDGHVEYQKRQKWMAATATARKRWNNDAQAHPETWKP